MLILPSFLMNEDWAFSKVALILDISSAAEVAFTKKVLSSAQDKILHKESSKLLTRSLLKQMKSSGPRIEPCGSPVVIGFSEEVKYLNFFIRPDFHSEKWFDKIEDL